MIKCEGKGVDGSNFLTLPLKLQSKARFPLGCAVDVYCHGAEDLKENLEGSNIFRGHIIDMGIDTSPQCSRELIYKIVRLSISSSSIPVICFAHADSLQFSFGSPVWVASKEKWEKATVMGSSSHSLVKDQASLSTFSYYVQLASAKECRWIRPEELVYRGQHDLQPEQKEAKPDIIASPLLNGNLPSTDTDVAQALENTVVPLPSNKVTPDAMPMVESMVEDSSSSGFAQFCLPPQFRSRAYQNKIQSQFWPEGARVHLSTNKNFDIVAIIDYANTATLRQCQLEIERILLFATPPPLRGCLLVKLAERNQYRRQCGDIVQSRNPFAIDKRGAEELHFVTLLEQQNYRCVSFSSMPCHEWKHHLEMHYPSCRVVMINQRACDQHETTVDERPMANARTSICPHIIVSGPIFDDVYECRMLLESYIESGRA